MLRRLTLRLALLAHCAALPFSALAQSPEEKVDLAPKQLARLQSLTPADFLKTVRIKDDELEPTATLSTEDGWINKGRFTDRVRSDNFLRAFISKRTGETRYQVYEMVHYGAQWRDFRAVNHATPDGPQTSELTLIDKEVSGCSSGYCMYRETVGFNVSEKLLEQIASTYKAGASPPWRFRFKAQNGLDWEDLMSPAEAAGLLQAVQAYRAQISREVR